MVAVHEQVDDNNGEEAQAKDAHHEPCRLAPAPALGDPLVEEEGKAHPDEDADDFLGVAVHGAAVDGLGVEKPADNANGEERKACQCAPVVDGVKNVEGRDVGENARQVPFVLQARVEIEKEQACYKADGYERKGDVERAHVQGIEGRGKALWYCHHHLELPCRDAEEDEGKEGAEEQGDFLMDHNPQHKTAEHEKPGEHLQIGADRESASCLGVEAHEQDDCLQNEAAGRNAGSECAQCPVLDHHAHKACHAGKGIEHKCHESGYFGCDKH